MQNNNAIQSVVWEDFLSFFLLWLPWQPEFFMEHNYLKEFESGPPLEHSCEISEEKFFEGKVYRCTYG